MAPIQPHRLRPAGGAQAGRPGDPSRNVAGTCSTRCTTAGRADARSCRAVLPEKRRDARAPLPRLASRSPSVQPAPVRPSPSRRSARAPSRPDALRARPGRHGRPAAPGRAERRADPACRRRPPRALDRSRPLSGSQQPRGRLPGKGDGLDHIDPCRGPQWLLLRPVCVTTPHRVQRTRPLARPLSAGQGLHPRPVTRGWYLRNHAQTIMVTTPGTGPRRPTTRRALTRRSPASCPTS